MIWLLVWLQMSVGETTSTMNYYHIDTFSKKEDSLRE